MGFGRNLRVGHRIAVIIGMILFLGTIIILVDIIEINNVSEKSYDTFQKGIKPIILLNVVSSNFVEAKEELYNIVLNVSAGKSADANIKDIKGDYEATLTSLEDLKTYLRDQGGSEAQLEILNNLGEEVVNVLKTPIDEMEALVNKGIVDDATYLEVLNKSWEELERVERGILKIMGEKVESLEISTLENLAIAKKVVIFCFIALIVILMVCVLLGIYLTRSITIPLKALTLVTKELSIGNLNVNISKDGKDEIAMLSKDFSVVVDNFGGVIHDMEKMSNEHGMGEYEFRLDESNYSGAYKTVVIGVNEMVSTYVENFIEILMLMESFAKGDFSHNIKQFPGKQVRGNVVVESLRSNLKKVNIEIDALAKSATEGKLSSRTDIEGLEGDWVKILLSLNLVMEAIATPIQEASNVLSLIAKGQLDVKMVGEYQGDFQKIKQSLDFTIDELSSYISEISNILTRIADKDLTENIQRNYLGEFAVIRDSINVIVKNLNVIVDEISSSSEQVDMGAKSVSSTSMSLAEASIEQSHTVNELRISVSNINDQILSNAKNAKIADEISNVSMKNASNGKDEMHKMLESMDEIRNSSNDIGSIMKVIDDIAFQTNLLALNAAVEAARAGTHGKGFAVVAEEVRSLASRSQTAARETQSLIEAGINKIAEGTKIANSTSDSLIKIVENVAEVSGIISGISSASKEQTNSVEQLLTNIDKISSVVQTNSATAQESSAASEELSSQSEVLKNTLSSFRLKNL